jgi:uncharacterized membrane-anchored protein YjiN (DUF445 family)
MQQFFRKPKRIISTTGLAIGLLFSIGSSAPDHELIGQQIKAAKTIEDLSELFTQSENYIVKVNILNAVISIENKCNPKSSEFLKKVLNDQEPAVVDAAIMTIGKIRCSELEEVLVQSYKTWTLENSGSLNRQAIIIDALFAFKTDKSRRFLSDVLAQSIASEKQAQILSNIQQYRAISMLTDVDAFITKLNALIEKKDADSTQIESMRKSLLFAQGVKRTLKEGGAQ